jgi:hypothetical protein
VGRDHGTPLFRDLTHADKAVVDSGTSICLGPRPSSKRDIDHTKYGIMKGLKFGTLLEYKTWIKEFSIKYFRPYTIVHSDAKNLGLVGAGWARTWLYPGLLGSAGPQGPTHQRIAPVVRVLPLAA